MRIIFDIRTHQRLSQDFAVFLPRTWTLERKPFCMSVGVSKRFHQSTNLTKFLTDGRRKLNILVFLYYQKIMRKKYKKSKIYYKNWYINCIFWFLYAFCVTQHESHFGIKPGVNNFNFNYNPIINAFNLQWNLLSTQLIERHRT